MDKEKVDKIVKLADQLWRERNKYHDMTNVIDKQEKYSVDMKVRNIVNLITSIDGRYLQIPPEDLEQLFQQVYDTISKEWNKICDNQLQVVQSLENELDAL